MSRIGILGGTFDPVHIGHLLAAHAVREALDLARVLLIPAACSPNKRDQPLTAARHRVAMLRLSIADDPWLTVETLEVKRGGVSYAVDTLRALRAAHPDWRLHLIVGQDCLPDLPRWHEIGTILDLCRLVPVLRPGATAGRVLRAAGLPAPWLAGLRRRALRGRLCEVSATEIRRRVAAGDSIRYLVMPAVERYIRKHGLYAAG